MVTRFLLALAILLVADEAAAQRPAGGKQATRIGTFRGKVKVRSSFAVPGVVPRERSTDMTMTLTRKGRRLEVETTDPDAFGRGKGTTAKGVGRIVASRKVGAKEVIDVEFEGDEFTRSVEGQFSEAISRLPVARGVKVPIEKASGRTRITLEKDRLSIRSTTSATRGKLGGLRGRLAERVAPRDIDMEFSGTLDRE